MKLLPTSLIPGFLAVMAVLSPPAAMAANVWESIARVEFRVADSNRNGGIGVLELARFRRDMASIPWLLKTATWLEFTRADSNGDESISLEEWQSYRLGRRVNLLGDQVQRFRTADWNADRKLNVREIQLAFQPWLTPQQAKDTLSWLDSNADGLLTMGEFFRYVTLSPDALRGMRRKDAEDLLYAIGGSFHYTMFNGAIVDYFQQVHSLYSLRCDADVISGCGYGIDLKSLEGKTDAEAVKVAELAKLLPASPMPPGIFPDDPPTLKLSRPIYIDWDRTHPSPLNSGNVLRTPYLVIYARDGVVIYLEITMGSPPYP